MATNCGQRKISRYFNFLSDESALALFEPSHFRPQRRNQQLNGRFDSLST
jgi:hypothetical protein